MSARVISSAEGHLGNSQAQTLERAVDTKLTQEMAIAFSELMRVKWGRRVAYNLIFERGRIEAASFDFDIKDGICSAIHMARNEGIREYGIALAADLQKAFPEQWSLMIHERRVLDAEVADARAAARTTSAEKEDEP